jgi:hypothetical protein
VQHAAEMVVVLGAPELYRFTGGRPPDVRELRERYARQVKGRSPDGREVWRNWVARRRAAGVAVGWIQAALTGSGMQCTAELAWTIGADHHLGGRQRACVTPRATQRSSWRLLFSPSASTRSQPSITRPRISNGCACGLARSSSVSARTPSQLATPGD